jgi:hypothetical protein
MKSLIQANRMLKISTINLKKLMGNLDENTANAIFRPVMKDYMYVARQLLIIEHTMSLKPAPVQSEVSILEEGVSLAITAIGDIDKALNAAVDELHSA